MPILFARPRDPAVHLRALSDRDPRTSHPTYGAEVGRRARSVGPVIPMTRDQFDRWIEVLRPAFVGYLYNNWSTIRKRMLQEEIAHEAIAALYDSKAWTNFRGDPENRQAVLTWCLGYVKNTARKFTQPAERTGVKRTALRFTGQAGRTMPLLEKDPRLDPTASGGFPIPEEIRWVSATHVVESAPIETPPQTRAPAGFTRASVADELDAAATLNGNDTDQQPWAERTPGHQADKVRYWQTVKDADCTNRTGRLRRRSSRSRAPDERVQCQFSASSELPEM